MDRPNSLVGRAVAGAYICKDWELRVTARCLDEDLNADEATSFESILGLEIIKAFVKDRATEATASKQISPLSSGQKVWRLGYGHDHRGATFYDEDEAVIWLVAYGRHRSGASDDFFPYCKQLDAESRLLPTQQDIASMYRDRDRRFVNAVTIEAPLALKATRETEGEYCCTIGGELGAGLAIEVIEELEATSITVAFRPAAGGPLTTMTMEQGQVLLQSQWSYLSSVSHVTWYGLRQAITSTAPTPGLGPGLATYGTTSSSVRAQALCVLIALRKAADSRFVLMGWADEDWRAVCERAQAHELTLMQAYRQGNA